MLKSRVLVVADASMIVVAAAGAFLIIQRPASLWSAASIKPIEETATFVASSRTQKAVCETEEKVELSNAGLGNRSLGNIHDCVKTVDNWMRKSYADLNPMIKSASAIAALKKYHAAWLTALESTHPVHGETTKDYITRQEGANTNLAELGNRLRVEVEN